MNNPTLRDFPFSNKFLGPIRKLRNTLFQLRKDESNLALAIRFMVLLAGLGEMLYLLHETYLIQTKGALTLDYTVFEQARYLIAHGHINPFDTVRGRGFYFYKDHFELIIWPLAWISAIVPLPSWIYMRVIIEVLPVTLSFFITVKWSREILAERIKKDWLRELTVALISSTIITSVGIYSAVAFDIHLQMLIGFLLLLGARALYKKNLIVAWISVAVLLVSGDPAVTMVFGLGITALMLRTPRKHAFGMMASAIATYILIAATHSSNGSSLYAIYNGVLPASMSTGVSAAPFAKYIVTHPVNDFKYLISQRSLIFSNVELFGIIAFFSPLFGVLLFPFFENALAVPAFSQPGFQWAPFYLVAPVAASFFVSYLLGKNRFSRVIPFLLGIFLVSNFTIMAQNWRVNHALWYQQFLSNISPSTSSIISNLSKTTPTDVEVLADNGFVGDFADRPAVVSYYGNNLPLFSQKVLFLATLDQGVAVEPSFSQAAYLQQISKYAGAKVHAYSNNVIGVNWTAPKTVHSINFLNPTSAPAALIGSPGTVIFKNGYMSKWILSSNQVPGQIINTGTILMKSGTFDFSITYKSSAPLLLNVFNAGKVSVQLNLPPSSSFTTFSKTLTVPTYVPSSGVTVQLFEKSGTSAYFTGESQLNYQ